MKPTHIKYSHNCIIYVLNLYVFVYFNIVIRVINVLRASDLAVCVAPLPHCLMVGAVLYQYNGGVAAVSFLLILAELA